MSDATPPEFRKRLVQSMVEFASLWMKFVTERCERGKFITLRYLIIVFHYLKLITFFTYFLYGLIMIFLIVVNFDYFCRKYF